MTIPPELLAERPGLAYVENVTHPSTSPPSNAAPPRKYTIAVHERICEELKRGQRPQGACALAGITVATFYEWVRRGKSGDPYLAQFAEDVEIAYNTAEAIASGVINEGFTSDNPELRNVESAKWFLERQRSDGYAKKVKTEVESQVQEFLSRLEAALSTMPSQLMDGPKVLQLIYSVYLGKNPSAELGPKVEPLLLTHAQTEATAEERV